MLQPEGFRHATTIVVRFADLDAMGHLNHAKYLTYAEQARISYIAEVCGWSGADWESFGVILARAECDYKLPVAFGDSVTVWSRVSRLGGKSFDFAYVLVRHRPKQPDAICATAKTVMVGYDYAAGATVAIPQAWRERIRSYEPEL